MAPNSAGMNGYSDAKDFLDKIGEVYEEIVKNGDAKTYKQALKGDLQKAASTSLELNYTADTCQLVDDYYNKRVNGNSNRYPCESLSGKDVNRFSDTLGGQCTNSKMRSGGEGACAPYRRLHVCDKNLEQIKAEQITTHNLLAEVCMAAKFEGQSIRGYYPQYETQYPGSGSGSAMCTMLARSFADIGDIVRGKDLFYGNTQEKEQRKQLDDKLKKIFGDIYKELTKNGKTNKEAAKERYKDTANYYELREDWWNANRATIWEAITCGAHGTYFRATCGESRSPSMAKNKCRCDDKSKAGNGDVNIVPTYFDYVPQYLRWFEEWAEDFCRLRKRKLENAKSKCRRVENGKDKYCDLNRYDCEKTASGKHVFVEDEDCKDCQYSCARFVKWIDNQKLEFDKQKNKYTKEMQKYTKEITSGGSGRSSRRKKRSASTTNYDGYERKFYDKFKTGYSDVNKFLDLLSKETTCTKNADIKEGGTINFKNVNSGKNSDGDGSNKTFYRTTYCEACPWCGAQKKSNGGNGWEAKNDTECAKEEKKTYEKKNITDIPILTPEKGKSGIVKKYSKFCKNGANGEKGANGGGQIKNWQCYYDDSNKNSGQNNNNCVEGTWEKFTGKQTVKSYNAFFWDWVYHMLHDSVEWKTELDNCINNESKPCKKNNCNDKCKCYESWVQQKEKEWGKIKEHFGKQKDIVQETHCDPGVTLEFLLDKDELLKIIEGTYGNTEEIQHLRQMLQQAGVGGGGSGGFGTGAMCRTGGANGKNSIIDKLLDHEEKEAKQCKKTQEECEKKKQQQQEQDTSPARSNTGPREDALPPTEEEEDDDDEDDADGTETTQQDTQPKVEVNPCEIVNTLFNDPSNFSDACKLKYGPGGKEKFPNWKCISSGSDSTTERSRVARSADGATGKSDASGSICIPPRRRKLYVGELTKWAEIQLKSQAGGEAAQGNGVSTSTTESSLLHAFVKSAAVETFFLWHRYKKEKEIEKKQQQENGGLDPFLNGDTISGDQTPEQQLKSGNIPPSFLRQMFYTLGDYRDILFSGSNDTTSVSKDTPSRSSNDNLKNIVLLVSENQDEKQKMENIKKAIEQILPKNGTPHPKTIGQTPDKWWERNAEAIWEGMICALTYKDGGEGKPPEQDTKVKEKLLDNNNKPQNSQYEYGSVTISSVPSGDNTPLSKFVERPTYFRYLQEWGENFCVKRKEMLAQIKKDCYKNGGTGEKQYSGDGEDCTQMLPDDPTTLPALGYSCPKSCRFYKKWIERKKIEFNKQSGAYSEQKKKYEDESNGAGRNNGGNEFSKTLESRPEAKDFLQKLVSCKNNNRNENAEDNKKIFDDEGETFQHATDCDPCSEFKVKLEKCNCTGASKANTCNGGRINAENIIDDKNGNENIVMIVSDDSTKQFEGGLKDACKGKGIFEGIRKDVWKCGNVCGYVVCKPENGNGIENQNKIITIRGLVEHWVHNFLEDYNKIRKKLKSCIENGNGSICTSDCGKKCDCVKDWITKKKDEWKEIKKRFLEQYKNPDNYNVRSVLEEVIPENHLVNAKNKIIKLSKFDNFCSCSASAHKQKDSNQDAIDCMLQKLQKKIDDCKNKPSGTDCHPSTPVGDDDDPLEEENQTPDEAQKMIPKICGNMPTQPEQQEEEENICTPAETVKKEAEEKEKEKTNKGDEETEQPAPAPAEPPAAPLAPADEPFDPTILQTTIPFGVALALGSIAFLFLKKKTKSSVGNLFQILQIPKSDYDIPTLKSKNRYIPYRSGTYKGKTYIYMEGDTSGDEDKYIGDITSSDITSSESEYEELDINDIYVPGSPKYKTLIEVVLEPSGNNTTASGKNTPSDTQNDIQNDGIPSSKITDNEWNQLKHDFISNMLQNEPKDVPNDYTSGNSSTNTNITTTSRHNVEEKPFITSIHDRNLYSGEEYNYDMSTNSGNNDLYNGKNNLYSGQNNVYSGIDPTSDNRGPYSDKNDRISDNHHPYSGIDLINDSLSGEPINIYDELLKRKENELFGTNHVKQTSIHSVAKLTNSDPIHNQLNLFHKWLDRHRNMCEKWKNKEDILNKLKEEWNKENNNNGDKTYNSDNKPSHNHVLNTDVSIQIDMHNPKPKNEFTNMDTNPDKSTMDTILDDLEKYNEPYYYDFYKDDIYYDVNDDDKTSVDHINMDHNKMDNNNSDVPTKVQIEMNVINNQELLQNEYPISHM
ncbi:erythrocyte membrane protein 1 [Plasmodium falciparum RAJ116]|uniref:Erythrocyte membrane protein 1 n=1 Tax=Plasmodium falciparum RAJ116 TaxID=580058 RepID=A0A0L0CTJ9_PLAFA|nr:erythrocyte membrane protein 1 [Plasmodium falciparum RAJ116]